MEKIGLAQNLIIMWDFFSQCGVKRKRDFINNAELLVNSWIKLLRTAMYCHSKEIIDKLDASAKEFLNRFINKCLKIVDRTEDTCDGVEITQVKGTSNIFATLAEMSLFCYDITINLIHEKINICTSAYRDQVAKKSDVPRKLEDRLGWLIQFVSFILKAKANNPKGFSTSDRKEVEIYVTVLRLMQHTSSLYQQNYFVSRGLEFAYLSFCDGFRKEVIGNPKEVTSSSNTFATTDTYAILEEQLNVKTFGQIIDLLLQKLYRVL